MIASGNVEQVPTAVGTCSSAPGWKRTRRMTAEADPGELVQREYDRNACSDQTNLPCSRASTMSR